MRKNFAFCAKSYNEHGNPILKEDSSEEEKLPLKETLPYRFRTAPYPFGTAEPEALS